jgi:hypothetical protein
MAVCAIPTSSAGHALAGAKTNPKLTFLADHLLGAGHEQGNGWSVWVGQEILNFGNFSRGGSAYKRRGITASPHPLPPCIASLHMSGSRL